MFSLFVQNYKLFFREERIENVYNLILNCIQLESYLYPTCILIASHLYPNCILIASHLYPTCILIASNLNPICRTPNCHSFLVLSLISRSHMHTNTTYIVPQIVTHFSFCHSFIVPIWMLHGCVRVHSNTQRKLN